MKAFTSRIVLCVCLAALAIPFTATPAAAGTHCTTDEAKAKLSPPAGPRPAGNQDGLPLCADKLVEKFFDSTLGGVIKKILGVAGALLVLVMVAKALLEAVQGGGGLSRALGPIVASFIVAALLFNVQLLAVVVAKLVSGIGDGASTVLPFM